MDTTETATPRQRKPRPKPARTVRLVLPPTPTMPGIVQITVGGKATDYFLSPIPADFGTAFRLEKVGDGEAYNVNLDGDKRSCECKGHQRHGHCKHADGLAALIAAGQL
jgi:hypothetical protein